MPKLPVVSGSELVHALEQLGYQQVSQRGSHVKMRRERIKCIVPLHRELKRGTLTGILAAADVSLDDLRRVLSH